MGNVLKTQRWLRVRTRQLAREPLCRECGKPATDVDHIVPRSRGGDPFDQSNLQSMCGPCHSRKTGAFDKQGRHWGIQGYAADGFPLDQSHPWYSQAEGAIVRQTGKREDRRRGRGQSLFFEG